MKLEVPVGATLGPDPVSVPHRLTGSLLFLLAGLAALGELSTNIILPAFPDMGRDLGVSTKDLGVTFSSFFVAFATGHFWWGRCPIALAENTWCWAAWRCSWPAARCARWRRACPG